MAGRVAQASSTKRLEDAEYAIRRALSHEGKIAATVKAAELCVDLLKISSDPQEKKKLQQACSNHIDQAEWLKKSSFIPTEGGGRTASQTPVSSPSSLRVLKAPVSSRVLSTAERIILLRGSSLHGCVFPAWTTNPIQNEFRLANGDEKFEDAAELTLSQLQEKAFDGWRRPEDTSFASMSDIPSTKAEPTMITTKDADLVQDMTSDCSVVASLCAGVARAQRGHPKLLESLMFPYDHTSKRPMMSPNGKYVFKMNFNGCFRRVVVDDRLPSSKTNRMLHVSDRSNPGLLWPPLIEKAYLKTRGGYDFPGSNSGTDLWILSGWIPEQVFLWDDDLTVGDTWKRLYNAFNFGDVLATLGTGKLSAFERNRMLANEHDYAVVDMKEDKPGKRSFLIKNPWANSGHWQNSSDQDDKSQHEFLPGHFWMDTHEIVQSFKYMYLNWNPGLFSYRQDLHFTWDLQKCRSALGSFKSNPQYLLKCQKDGRCWILLNRHFQNSVPSEVRLDKTAPSYISLYSFEGKEHRTLLTGKSSQRSAYMETTNVLLKTGMTAGSNQVIVVSEEALPMRSHDFTLSIFSTMPVEVDKARDRYQYETEETGAWTFSTAGGNANSFDYKINPQYSITVSAACDIALLLSIESSDILIHVKLVYSNGERIKTIQSRDILGGSGDYCKGSAICEVRNVQPGTYTVICSTYESGQRAKFSLSIKSTIPCLVKKFPPEGTGRLITKVPRVTFAQDMDRFLCPIQVPRITRVRTVACRPPYSRSVKASPLRVSLELGQGPEKEVLAISGNGEFVDAQGEIGLKDVDVLPAMCQSCGVWLVVERLGGSYVYDNDFLDVEFFCDARIGVGQWGTAL